MAKGSGLWTSQRAVKPHLVRGTGGLQAEIGDLRDDLTRELAGLTALAVDEWTNVALSDVNAIKESVASAASIQTYTGAALDGAVGTGTMSPPRNIIITTTSNADIDAVDVVITGLDVDGAVLTDTITLTDGGNATDVGTSCFASVSSIVVPAQSGTGGAMEFGFGNAIGFSESIATKGGLTALLTEVVGGTNVSETVVEEFVDPAAADTNAIKTSIASNDTPVTYSGADLNGVIGEGLISPPRNFTITSSAHADVDAVDCVVTGLDIYGNVTTDTITMTADTGATDVGVVAFSYITSIYMPAHTGTNATFEFGFGDVIGLAAPIRHIAGDPQVLLENESGTPKAGDVLAGTYVAAASSYPCGTVAPSDVPDASSDYGYVYVAAKGTVATAAAALPYGSYTPVAPPGGGVDIVVYYEFDPTA
jgi:hypothetical protein